MSLSFPHIFLQSAAFALCLSSSLSLPLFAMEDEVKEGTTERARQDIEALQAELADSERHTKDLQLAHKQEEINLIENRMKALKDSHVALNPEWGALWGELRQKRNELAALQGEPLVEDNPTRRIAGIEPEAPAKSAEILAKEAEIQNLERQFNAALAVSYPDDAEKAAIQRQIIDTLAKLIKIRLEELEALRGAGSRSETRAFNDTNWENLITD